MKVFLFYRFFELKNELLSNKIDEFVEFLQVYAMFALSLQNNLLIVRRCFK